MPTCWQEVPPTEDLMREHGVLNRVLMIYDKINSQITQNQPFNHFLLVQAATIVRDFIHNYHEKLEEEYLFTIFEKKNLPLASLTKVLREQHTAGKAVTDMILYRATESNITDPENLKKLSEDIHGFVEMYRPHEAREDTELFPAVRANVTEAEFERLTDIFEDTEHAKFGPTGFEDMVKIVADIEKQLGINNIAQYTPHAE